MSENLFENLLKERDAWREKMKTAKTLIKWRDLPWEINRQGKMKWYVHPRKPDTCTKTFVLYVQEIPPQGHSGKQKVPGGIAHVLLNGRMTAVVDGKRYDWNQGDAIHVPPGMLHHQHFNPFDRDMKELRFEFDVRYWFVDQWKGYVPFDGLPQADREFQAYRRLLQNLLNNMGSVQGAAVQDAERKAQTIHARIAARGRAKKTKS